ncbi:MAG: hypothetical protein GY866_24990 [Proteobacteria bacterium]|nr:hypothetical protein [Pseudomonadota bacterium]
MLAAFDHYLKHRNNGRPFIVGKSQRRSFDVSSVYQARTHLKDDPEMKIIGDQESSARNQYRGKTTMKKDEIWQQAAQTVVNAGWNSGPHRDRTKITWHKLSAKVP